jgi:hypothetical protein
MTADPHIMGFIPLMIGCLVLGDQSTRQPFHLYAVFIQDLQELYAVHAWAVI